MRPWKWFAWFAFGWTLLLRRGRGVIIRKKNAAETADSAETQAQSGPGWRRVSSQRADLAKGGGQADRETTARETPEIRE